MEQWSLSSDKRHQYTTIFNFRNVTGKVNAYRSAALDHASEADYEYYLLSTNIIYRIDLRSPLEKLKSEYEKPLYIPLKGTFMAKRISTNEVGIQDNSLAKATAKQLRFSDILTIGRESNVKKEEIVSKLTTYKAGKKIDTFHVNFLNAHYRNKVIWDRSTRSEKLKIFAYMITFRYNALIKFIGEKIISRGGLLGSYQDFLDYSSESIANALFIITECLEKNNGAVAWSCFAGKDRTGLVTALIKYIIGDSMEDIIDDYAESEIGLSSIMSQMIQEFSSQGLPEEFAKSPRIVIENTFVYIVEKYGSVERYLDQIGFNVSWRIRLNACKKE
jgi:hypothetical protein